MEQASGLPLPFRGGGMRVPPELRSAENRLPVGTVLLLVLDDL
jgi:hypothetical protein